MRVAVIVALGVVAATMHARAETITDRAKRLFDEGLVLEDRGDSGACKLFEESYDLVAAAGTGFNLAECMERKGRVLRAWELYQAAATEWMRDAKDKRAAIARERAAALEHKLVTIIIELANPDLELLTITLGERRLTPAPTIRALADPGRVEIRAVAPGYVPYVDVAEASAGTTKQFRIELAAVAAEPPPIVRTQRRRSRIAVSVGLGGIAIGSLVAGGVFFAQARQLQDDGFREGAVRRADLATVLGVAGGAIAIGAVVVYVTAPYDVTVIPIASTRSAGLVLSRAF
ncbi:MAG TPA: hypothetical protein VMZ53_19485 [Kofleriaceae bacterium]|nr:hypothetical protein [Kofleriaceae bacterium]